LIRSLPLPLRTVPPSPAAGGRRLSRALRALTAGVALLAAASLAAGAAEPAPQAFGLGGTWKAQGPSPVIGDLDHVDPDDGVEGAIKALVPHPTLANVLWAGAVNGGVWVTHDATDEKPTWRELTDSQPSQAIGALALDPTDRHYGTLVAGPGNYSAYGDGGDFAGLLRTTNGGATWTRLTGGGVMVGKSISGVAPRGRIIVAAVNFATPFTFGNVGIFRSDDFGATFTQISQNRGGATGLPGGITHDLAGDPLRPARLFTSVVLGDVSGGKNGIYRSENTGATWRKVSSPAVDAYLKSAHTNNVRLAVGRHNEVYAAIADDFQLAAVFRSGDGGATWMQMDLPQTIEDGVAIGINPGFQADLHLSLLADPANATLVYIGGDRQPALNEADPNAAQPIFPNSIGATGYWGRLFRGDASRPAGSQWVHLTASNTEGPAGGGTAHNSSPHVDSRAMAFDANGNLLEGDDGGVYKRTQPRNNQGDWFSLNGSLQVTEVQDVAFDRNSRILFAGNQDNDSAVQNLPGSLDWGALLYGDGGDVDVDDTSTPGQSVRFTSASFLRNFNHSTWDAAGNFLSFDLVALNVLDGGADIVPQFYTPMRLSGGDPMRMVIGGANGVYESFDQGDSLKEIAPGIRANSLSLEGLAYGVPANPDALYIGGSDDPHVVPGAKLWVRTAPPPAPLLQSVSYPGILPIAGIAIDPRNGSHAFVVDGSDVFQTSDAGVSWSSVNGNLARLNPSLVRSAVYVNTPLGDALVVGANHGAYFATARSGFAQWHRLGSLLPTAPILSLRYDPKGDQLTAGLLGRGVFILTNVGAAVMLAN
jgi:photosystem II stability/assembly factor-like uncharacterized protein